MNAFTTVLAAAVAAGLTAAIVLGSALPYTDEPADRALIRLSWRAVGERSEECRRPSEAEMAALPPHMRLSEICEARLSPFHLVVAIDDATVFDGQIRSAGAREDRPAYVFREFGVAPGSHRLRVRFEPQLAEGAAAGERPPLLLDRTVTLSPREILLVTTAAETGELSLTGASQSR